MSLFAEKPARRKKRKVPNLHIGAKSFHLDNGGGKAMTNESGRSDWSLYCDEHHETVNDLTSNNMVRL